jgi:branched-chain amino acid transport system permease protein
MTIQTQARRPPLAALLRRPRGYLVSALGFALLALVGVWLIGNLVKTPTDFVNVLFIGITIGAIYGLIALGYTLVYGILELINFAHGDVFMLGGMMAITTITATFGLSGGEAAYVVWPSLLGSLIICMAFCGALNATVELVAYRRLRGAPRLAPLITAIGASFILQNVGLAWKGPNFVTLPDGIIPSGNVFSVGGISYSWDKFLVVLVTVPMLLGLTWLVQRTRQGKAMRAVAQDRDAAAMMGVSVNRTVSFTFALAGAMAGAAGLLFALYVQNVRFDTGFQLGLIAFTAAVLGGIGNLSGAVLGGLIIGLIQAFNNGLTWATPGSDWTESIVFSILILILVFRPEGLLGERTPEGQ